MNVAGDSLDQPVMLVTMKPTSGNNWVPMPLDRCPHCSVVKQITPKHLVAYATAPKGKRLHYGCPAVD